MKRFLIVFYILIFLIFLIFFDQYKEESVFKEISTDDYTRFEESEISIQRKEIIKYLKSNGIKGDIENNIQINFIKGNNQLKQLGIKLARVHLDYAWLDGYIIYSNNEIIGLFDGMSIRGLYMTDLNKDGSIEILCHSNNGSGLLWIDISVYDTKTEKIYNASYYNANEDITFAVSSNRIMAYSYNQGTKEKSDKPIGYLEFTENEIKINSMETFEYKLEN